jgi:hypothetical protein
MGLTKETASGKNFLEREVSQSEAIKAISAIQSFDTQPGSNGASGNTVFTLPFSYIPDTNTLMVFINGQKSEVKVTPTEATQYEETNSYVVTFGGPLLNSDIVEFIVAGAYIIEDLSSLGIIPQGETILFQSDVNVLGYTMEVGIDDELVYISSGGAGGPHPTGTWTQDLHNHLIQDYQGANVWHLFDAAGVGKTKAAFGYGSSTLSLGIAMGVSGGNPDTRQGDFWTEMKATPNTWRPKGQNFTRQTKN